jgi:hypothetical protein
MQEAVELTAADLRCANLVEENPWPQALRRNMAQPCSS